MTDNNTLMDPTSFVVTHYVYAQNEAELDKLLAKMRSALGPAADQYHEVLREQDPAGHWVAHIQQKRS